MVHMVNGAILIGKYKTNLQKYFQSKSLDIQASVVCSLGTVAAGNWFFTVFFLVSELRMKEVLLN